MTQQSIGHQLTVSPIHVAKLSREEVAAKYGPKVDANWNREREDAFFQGLPKGPRRAPLKMTPVKSSLLKQYAGEILGAKRMSDKYINALASVLASFAEADDFGIEVLLSQRSDKHGEPRTIRTIQAQMLDARLLTKEVRTQGRGFVGPVFVYSPQSINRCNKATWYDKETWDDSIWDDLVAIWRAGEQADFSPSEPYPETFITEDILCERSLTTHL